MAAMAGDEEEEAAAAGRKGDDGPIPDGRYELTAFAMDESRASAIATATFHGTQTGEGGPIPPTGNKVAADYVYEMVFDGDKISHMTKIWNDGISLVQLGWA